MLSFYNNSATKEVPVKNELCAHTLTPNINIKYNFSAIVFLSTN